MKKWIKSVMSVFLLLVLLGACGGYFAARHHFVMTEGRVALLEKRFLDHEDTWVDITAWAAEDFDRHPNVTHALSSQGYRDLVVEHEVVERDAESTGGRIAQHLHDIGEKLLGATGDLKRGAYAWMEETLGYWSDVLSSDDAHNG